MQYILMLYVNEAGWPKLTPAEQAQGMAAYVAYTEALQKAGVLEHEPAAAERGATTVRAVGGKPEVLDGPYTDSKEQIGGYYLHRGAGSGRGALLGCALSGDRSWRGRGATALATFGVKMVRASRPDRKGGRGPGRRASAPTSHAERLDRDGPAEAGRIAEVVARRSYGQAGRLSRGPHARRGRRRRRAIGGLRRGARRTGRASGCPANPEAWLLTVARRKLIDAARRRQMRRGGDRTVCELIAEELPPRGAAAIPDHRLALLFACAHPGDRRGHPRAVHAAGGARASMPPAIASAFLMSPAAMGQRLVRAKTKIRMPAFRFAFPSGRELGERLETVLDAIYAAFAEGWLDPAGTDVAPPRSRRRSASSWAAGGRAAAGGARGARPAGAHARTPRRAEQRDATPRANTSRWPSRTGALGRAH